MAIHRRATGGRAIALGPGTPLVTLGLPHRSALVGAARDALRPEQVLNRAVRGLLAALRDLGLDPTYPGLDLVTIGRRIVAFLVFVEEDDDVTLVQIALSVRERLSRTLALLDRADPGGIVAAAPIADEDCVALASLLAPDAVAAISAPDTLAALLTRGFSSASGCKVASGGAAETGAAPRGGPSPDEFDPSDDVAGLAEFAGQDRPPAPLPPPGAHVVRRACRTGVAEAWATIDGDRIVAAGLSGDLIAPPRSLRQLSAALAGAPASRLGIAAAAGSVLDGTRDYVLGLSPSELVALIAAAGNVA